MSASSDRPPDGSPPPARPPAPAFEAAIVRTVLITADLHARPAGRLARTAAGFTATTAVLAGERSADARSVLAVMSLGATAGTAVTVRASGPDAGPAADALAAVLAAPD